MIEYTLDAALGSMENQDEVCVSTDDMEIIQIVERYGVNVPFVQPLQPQQIPCSQLRHVIQQLPATPSLQLAMANVLKRHRISRTCFKIIVVTIAIFCFFNSNSTRAIDKKITVSNISVTISKNQHTFRIVCESVKTTNVFA